MKLTIKSCAANRTIPPRKCDRSISFEIVLDNKAISLSMASYNEVVKQFGLLVTVGDDIGRGVGLGVGRGVGRGVGLGVGCGLLCSGR